MLEQVYTGRSGILQGERSLGRTLLVAVTCGIEGLEDRHIALLDTACTWCMMTPEIATLLNYEFRGDEDTGVIRTFMGDMHGHCERHTLSLIAEEGKTLDVDATWFIAENWTGPLIIGWKGCLERIRFALDPNANDFYFAAADEE